MFTDDNQNKEHVGNTCDSFKDEFKLYANN